MKEKNINNILFIAVIIVVICYLVYIKQNNEGEIIENFTLSNESTKKINFSLAENEKTKQDYYDNRYDQYDDWNHYHNQSLKELGELNQYFIPLESTEENPDPRINPEKYVDAVNDNSKIIHDRELLKLNKLGLGISENLSYFPNDPYNVGEEYLRDEYDDPVDKINEYISYVRKGDMKDMQNLKISQVYDRLTKGIDMPRKTVKQPMIDPVTHDPIYVNELNGLQRSIRPDQWMYENEHENHGGHMGNGLFGYDPMDSYQVLHTRSG